MINCKDEFKHWPESIKSAMQWFPFLEIMKYTGNDMQNDSGQCLNSSLRLIIFLVEGTCVKVIFFVLCSINI